MNATILMSLVQDGITSGALYALLGFGVVLVFAVTRVILIPQGEFITFGALTYATLSAGRAHATAWLSRQAWRHYVLSWLSRAKAWAFAACCGK